MKPSQSAGSAISIEEINQLTVGTKVNHDRFGKGEITGLEVKYPIEKQL